MLEAELPESRALVRVQCPMLLGVFIATGVGQPHIETCIGQ